MKKLLKLSLLIITFLSLSISCEREIETELEDVGNIGVLEGPEVSSISGKSSVLTGKFSCGGSYSGTFTTINSYHNYTPYKTIDVSCAAPGAVITISVVAYDIPNRFTLKNASGGTVQIKNSSGSMVYNTGWMGTASYPGPWGSSLSTNGSATFTFVKTQNIYQLQVETQTPPNYSYSPNQDNWGVTVSCSCVSTGGTGDNDGGTCTTANNCGDNYVGNYNTVNRWYTYPVKNLNVSCVADGATIQLFVSALDVPNKFTIKDTNGNIIVSSGWMGNASYPGQWGSSLSTVNTKTLYFTKSASFYEYKLYVETQTPPNTSYYPTYDSWQASLGCTPNN